ncbi:MAG: ribosome-associated translation inhibitor RaiA [Flavobacteriales bacterium]|jgi:putative sigma-54 modulation protein|nr:MAG: ribosome-associated translation inhibitor RaiA [Flavobacteriales bacterium]MBE7441367.1 ribosome-associated translation inhibitor RaiA [Flavobacteriales bacterium]MBX2958497.1 ribosome-associated translation inhibitor RaiA [Flavobacteriales bacterium]
MKVNLKITSVHFDADKKLLEFIQEKVNKLGQYYDKIIDGDVILKVDNNPTGENKVAEIKLSVPGNDIFAKKQCKTFEEATDLAVEALRRQLKKHKEKLSKV